MYIKEAQLNSLDLQHLKPAQTEKIFRTPSTHQSRKRKLNRTKNLLELGIHQKGLRGNFYKITNQKISFNPAKPMLH